MEKAIRAVKEDKISMRAASKKFNVPYSSIRYKLKNGTVAKRKGRKPVLSAEEEERIVETIRAAKSFDINLRRRILLKAIGETKKFKNGIPSEQWWRMFRKRHSAVFSKNYGVARQPLNETPPKPLNEIPSTSFGETPSTTLNNSNETPSTSLKNSNFLNETPSTSLNEPKPLNETLSQLLIDVKKVYCIPPDRIPLSDSKPLSNIPLKPLSDSKPLNGIPANPLNRIPSKHSNEVPSNPLNRIPSNGIPSKNLNGSDSKKSTESTQGSFCRIQ